MDPKLEERAAIVAFLREQSDIGADKALAKDKGTTGRAAYGGGSFALKRAADAIEAGEHDFVAIERLDNQPALDSYREQLGKRTVAPKIERLDR